MKKILLAVALIMAFSGLGMAQTGTQPVILGDMVSAWNAASITDTSTSTHGTCRAVWIGTTQSDDFYINGAWVTFQGATAGTVLPIQAAGARVTSGSGSPASGDVVFLY